VRRGTDGQTVAYAERRRKADLGAAPGADQWGQRDEGAGGRGGPTLELDLCGLFLAGASAGAHSTHLGEGRVGVELGEGEERAGGRWPRAPARPAAAWSIRAPLSSVTGGGRQSRAQTGRSFLSLMRGCGAKRRELI
jgi:hypothetical protein